MNRAKALKMATIQNTRTTTMDPHKTLALVYDSGHNNVAETFTAMSQRVMLAAPNSTSRSTGSNLGAGSTFSEHLYSAFHGIWTVTSRCISGQFLG